jgi:hypothetical protein
MNKQIQGADSEEMVHEGTWVMLEGLSKSQNKEHHQHQPAEKRTFKLYPQNEEAAI